jgi:hypothetical protein
VDVHGGIEFGECGYLVVATFESAFLVIDMEWAFSVCSSFDLECAMLCSTHLFVWTFKAKIDLNTNLLEA